MTFDEMLEVNVYHGVRIADAITRYSEGDNDMAREIVALWEYSKQVENSGIKDAGYLAMCIRNISRSLSSLSSNNSARNARKQLRQIDRAISDIERKLTQIAYESEVS